MRCAAARRCTSISRFRPTSLLASLTGIAATIVASVGVRCGVIGMIEFGAG